MDQAELTRLQAYLRKVLNAPGIAVRAGGEEDGEVVVGGAKVADITRDEEDGELSYYVNMGASRSPGAAKDAPLDAGERERLQKELRARLGAPLLMVRPRPRKTDSAEVYVGDEFIGTLSADSGEVGYFLTMSILDIDLDEA